jgi:hypothetical protein
MGNKGYVTAAGIEAIEEFVSKTGVLQNVWKRNKAFVERRLRGDDIQLAVPTVSTAIRNRALKSLVTEYPQEEFIASDADRQLAIKHGQAYAYAKYIDRGPNDATRNAVMKKTNAYRYALYIDNGPRDDTRAAAIKQGYGYLYARYVDRGPRDDTRLSAIKTGGYFAYRYARYVDRCPRSDTRREACRHKYGYQYARYVDDCRRSDTARASGSYAVAYAKYFDSGCPTAETRAAARKSSWVTLLKYILQIEGGRTATLEPSILDEYRNLVCSSGFRTGVIDYAELVDKGPHDLTRQTACRQGQGFAYAQRVDKGPHDLTRLASNEMAINYALEIDKKPHPVTLLLCLKHRNDLGYHRSTEQLDRYLSAFGGPQCWMTEYLRTPESGEHK